MSNLVPFITPFVSIFTFIFFFWRRMKEDFDSSLIFKASFLLTAFFLLGSYIFVNIVPLVFKSSVVFSYTGLWFWGAITGTFFGYLGVLRIFKFPRYEAFEAISVAFLISSIFITFEVIAPAMGIAMYYFIRARYKSFAWYKSGKIGIAGLCGIGTFFVGRSLLALFGNSVLGSTGIGKVEVVVSIALAFLSFFEVYNLGDSKK